MILYHNITIITSFSYQKDSSRESASFRPLVYYCFFCSIVDLSDSAPFFFSANLVSRVRIQSLSHSC